MNLIHSCNCVIPFKPGNNQDSLLFLGLYSNSSKFVTLAFLKKSRYFFFFIASFKAYVLCDLTAGPHCVHLDAHLK